MNTAALEEPTLRLRLFFVVMASAVIVTVFAGFAPTFYLRGSYAQTRPMSVLLHVHGIVFSAWVSLFLIQTLLIARGSRRLHQRLGWIGAGIAAAMVILVTAAMVEQLRRVNGFPPPPLALALSLFDIIVFATLVGAALYYRKRPIVSTLLVDAFFLPSFAYDLLTRRRIHPAYVVALVLIVLDQIAQATVVTWTPWINFSNSLQRIVA
jgi:hypothetical protein